MGRMGEHPLRVWNDKNLDPRNQRSLINLKIDDGKIIAVRR